MYKVVFTLNCSKEVSQMKKEGILSDDELLVIRAWIQEMSLNGPQYISECGYWNDHPLKEKRTNERSSSFSESGRIIYKINKNKILIRILKITPDHNYE